MHGGVWQQIVDEIDLEQDLSQQNVVEIIKNKLRKKHFSIYVEWRRGEFNVDHPFQSERAQCTLLDLFQNSLRKLKIVNSSNQIESQAETFSSISIAICNDSKSLK